MPIPKLKGKMQRDEVVQAYKEYGWHKEITIEWIEMDNRREPVYNRYNFKADTLPCDDANCRPYMLTFVMMMPTGVVHTCGKCKKTQGPLSVEDGSRIERRPISHREAWKVLDRTGQKPPVGMDTSQRGPELEIVF